MEDYRGRPVFFQFRLYLSIRQKCFEITSFWPLSIPVPARISKGQGFFSKERKGQGAFSIKTGHFFAPF
jgi:hypothetical protein